jgi:signal transduction histidine kinase
MSDQPIAEEALRTLVHDLRGALTAIRGYIELVQYSGPLTQSQREYSAAALQMVDNLTKRIEAWRTELSSSSDPFEATQSSDPIDDEQQEPPTPTAQIADEFFEEPP